MVSARMAHGRGFSFAELKKRHLADYHRLFGRVDLTLAGADGSGYTDEMLADYAAGKANPYLEMLYFQYGRYLLISSSRPGTLPAICRAPGTATIFHPGAADIGTTSMCR